MIYKRIVNRDYVMTVNNNRLIVSSLESLHCRVEALEKLDLGVDASQEYYPQKCFGPIKTMGDEDYVHRSEEFQRYRIRELEEPPDYSRDPKQVKSLYERTKRLFHIIMDGGELFRDGTYGLYIPTKGKYFTRFMLTQYGPMMIKEYFMSLLQNWIIDLSLSEDRVSSDLRNKTRNKIGTANRLISEMLTLGLITHNEADKIFVLRPLDTYKTDSFNDHQS